MNLLLIAEVVLTAALLVGWWQRDRLGTRYRPAAVGLSALLMIALAADWAASGIGAWTAALALMAIVLLIAEFARSIGARGSGRMP